MAQDRLGNYEELSTSLRAKVNRLTMETAGLRAHNEALLEAGTGNAEPDLQSMEEIWGLVQPEMRLQHSAMHDKLAAVFSCISIGESMMPKAVDTRFKPLPLVKESLHAALEG
jgi:hypothetical protein